MIRIVALTDAGRRLAKRLQDRLQNSELWYRPQPFAAKLQHAFEQGDHLILICSTGIAVRCLAPVLKSKHKDPPVLVLDDQGHYVIPLLSGHEGGANEWGRQISAILKAHLVLTSAHSYLHPVYTAGLGCERGCSLATLRHLLVECLQKAEIGIHHLRCISSIDVKADEAAILALADELGKPCKFFSARELQSVDSLLSTRSEYVYSTVGVYGVAESAALYSAQNITGTHPDLLLAKQKTAQATCALAVSHPKGSETTDNNALSADNAGASRPSSPTDFQSDKTAP